MPENSSLLESDWKKKLPKIAASETFEWPEHCSNIVAAIEMMYAKMTGFVVLGTMYVKAQKLE